MVTMDGVAIPVKGKCKVYRPKFNTYTGTYTTQNPPSKYSGGFIQFGGGTSPGIIFDATVETPNVAIAAGTVAFEQLAKITLGWQGVDLQGSYHKTKSVADFALDSADDIPRYYDPANPGEAIKPIVVGAFASIEDQDAPKIDVDPNYDDTAQYTGDYKTYLVYKPNADESIWVVLGRLNWNFAFDATYAEL